MFSPTNKQVLSFLNGSACRVETSADNASFNFFGTKPDKPCISVPARYMTDLCNNLYAAKEKLKLTVAVKGQDTVVASYPLFKAEDNTDIVLEVQTYNGSASIWLKKFRMADGQRRGCPGWVMFNDMEATVLHDFYTKSGINGSGATTVVKPF
jgi:hypothetical protein